MRERGSFDARLIPDFGTAGTGFTFFSLLPKKTRSALMSPLCCWIYWLESLLWGLPGGRSFPRFPSFEGWLNIRDDSAVDESEPSLQNSHFDLLEMIWEPSIKKEKTSQMFLPARRIPTAALSWNVGWVITALGFIRIYLLGEKCTKESSKVTWAQESSCLGKWCPVFRLEKPTGNEKKS